jgi:hypothetical protein
VTPAAGDPSLRLHLFEQVADGLHALVPTEITGWHQRNHRWGIKVWIGDAARPAREHLEAQVISPRHVADASTLAIEVGFHAEHNDPAENQGVLERLVAAEARWRPELGPAAEAGAFIGTDRGWIRVSETWPDPDLSDPDLPFEVAARLVDYLVLLPYLQMNPM